MKKLFSILILVALICAPTAAFATSGDAWTDGQAYGEMTKHKLSLGWKNVLTGWLDLFYEPDKAVQEDRSFWSGLGKGLVDAIVNTAGGAINLVTFPIPVEIPIPEGGINIA